jgi:hypothetical protein
MAEWAAKKLQVKFYVETCVEEAYKRNWDDVGKLMWIFLPPALLLMFGSVVGWIIQGFRP